MKNTTTNRKGQISMRNGLLALALAGAAAAGCGQTSYFEVSMDVTPDPGLSCLARIYTCQVSVTGADPDYFSLDDAACRMPRSAHLGMFQFSTEKDSGTVNFSIVIVDGLLKTLGTGTGSAAIKSGGRVALQVPIMPDDAAIAAQACK